MARDEQLDPQDSDQQSRASSFVRTGLECCLADLPDVLRHSRRWGLLLNQASVDRQGQYACDLLAQQFPGRLTCLLSPQHGLWGEQQANMIESPHSNYPPLRLPVYSLYGPTRRPTDTMLDDIDVLIVDLQDVGTRVYTFAWTVRECLRACAARSLPVVVLDRPNPLGGIIREGDLVDERFYSFVGHGAIPLRHGLTLGEIACWVNESQAIGAALTVVTMQGWHRSTMWHQIDLPWIATSPNMPRYETTVVYPGQVLLEGTNLSEGRGTTLPFEVCGAPFIDPFKLVRCLHDADIRTLTGITVRPIRFVPTFDKWKGLSCGGVALQFRDPAAVRSVRFTVELLRVVKQLYPDQFCWTDPPYEYEYERPPIDILWGSDRLRQGLDRSHSISLNPDLFPDLATRWTAAIGPSLLYA